jgi:hypothetical protein
MKLTPDKIVATTLLLAQARVQKVTYSLIIPKNADLISNCHEEKSLCLHDNLLVS